MNGPSPVAGITFTTAPLADRARGLLGFVRFDLGGLRIDGVAVRHTRRGRLALSFPERSSRGGSRHPLVRPLDAAARRAIEEQVLDALAPELVALEREEREARRTGGSR